MAISLKHDKVSDKSDGQDSSLLQPSHWNAEHVFKVEAKKLVGNSTSSSGNAAEISVGAGLKLDAGALTFSGSDALIVSAANPDLPTARVLTGVAPVTVDLTTVAQAKVSVADNGITLDKLDHGTKGDILYYGDSGAPARLPIGPVGTFLKTGTAAVVGPPAVAATNPSWAFSGAPHAVLKDKKGNGVAGGSFTVGDWRDRVLNDEAYDTYGFVTLASNAFTLVAGTYVIEWSTPAYNVTQHQSRLWNSTDSLILESGTAEFSGTTQNRSLGVAKFTIAASKALKIQHRCDSTRATDGFGAPANYNGMAEIYTIVKIWRVE